MLQQFLSLVLVGLGIVHGTSQGVVAGISDDKTSTGLRVASEASKNATASRQLKNIREKSKEASKSARAVFEQKLTAIKDEKKKASAERVNATLNTVNEKRTDALLAYINKISEILAKVQTRANTAKSNGKDTSKVDAAIAKATTDIATAKTAIEAQAAKQYTATITSETSLKTDMGTTMKQLQSDAGKVKDLVTTAHKSVSDAVKALASILGESGTKPATASGGRK